MGFIFKRLDLAIIGIIIIISRMKMLIAIAFCFRISLRCSLALFAWYWSKYQNKSCKGVIDWEMVWSCSQILLLLHAGQDVNICRANSMITNCCLQTNSGGVRDVCSHCQSNTSCLFSSSLFSQHSVHCLIQMIAIFRLATRYFDTKLFIVFYLFVLSIGTKKTHLWRVLSKFLSISRHTESGTVSSWDQIVSIYQVLSLFTHMLYN